MTNEKTRTIHGKRYEIGKEYFIELSNIPGMTLNDDFGVDESFKIKCKLIAFLDANANECMDCEVEGDFPNYGVTVMWIYVKDLEEITPITSAQIKETVSELESWISEMTHTTRQGSEHRKELNRG